MYAEIEISDGDHVEIKDIGELIKDRLYNKVHPQRALANLVEILTKKKLIDADELRYILDMVRRFDIHDE